MQSLRRLAYTATTATTTITTASLIRTMSTTTADAKTTTEWTPPTTVDANTKPKLHLYNTLTHSKVPFVPVESDRIKWYSCGPTVYNSSHMGHARNYVSIDINRRILQDYFGYDITFIQNVTDIDDKIIIKARQEHLYEQYLAKHVKVDEEFKKLVLESLQDYVSKNLPEYTNGDITTGFTKWVAGQDVKQIGLTNAKFPMHVKAVMATLNALTEEAMSYEEFTTAVKDVVVAKLDKDLGSTVTDPAVFRKCSSYWERQYDLDMLKLNVLPPTIVTRVSEYIPEIVTFVEKIVERGYAYATSDGSVYFSTGQFDNSEGHQYAKCQPWSKGDMALLADGEGSLTAGVVEGKRSASDFALWKASKAGEPAWPSPWGEGRPGWHIECSVMGSDFVGDKMDIHSGGIDLAFPHHDNEMAQSEAHFDCEQWVNYFLHTGHLHIEGQKMSKSLKNFITIDEALEKYSSRELRLIFALVQWNNPLDFKEALLNECRSVESTLDKFFNRVRAMKRENEERLSAGEVVSKKFGVLEKQLLKDFEASKASVHASLCDNLATPLAIRNMMELINASNVYMKESGSELKIDLVVEVVKYLTKMLRVFGFEVREDMLGWKEGEVANNSTGTGSGNGNREDMCMPFVSVLSKFRDVVRADGIKQGNKLLLEKCDNVRDNELLPLGVVLDDRSDGQGALVKFVTDKERDELLTLQREKESAAAAKLKKKAEQAAAAAAKEKELLEKGKLSPTEMFKTAEYNEWDSEGLPLRKADGEEVSKSARKKLVKQQQAQAKLHAAYLASL
jgi:cysteinyl-tRNA synthetase